MRAPSDAEFTGFVEEAWPGLYRTAYLLVGDRGLAEDLVQTSLTKTYVAWGQVRERYAARAYARTVLVNTATSWFRRRAWRAEVASPEVDASHGGPPTVGRSVEGDGTDRVVLAQALALLPPRQRAVVVLRFYDDLSVEQTAEVLGCAPGTVKSQTSHALGKLRSALGESFLTTTGGAHHD